MPTIRKRVGAKGTRFEAIIRRYRDNQRYRESRTFSTHADAERWAKEREDAISNPAASVYAHQSGGPCLAALIRWYINSFSNLTPWGRTKQTALEYLERHDIGKVDAPTLDAAMLVDHVRARRASGVAASTAGNDLTWIGCVLRAAKDCGECPHVDPSVVDAARGACNKLGLTAHSNRREVRPTPEQLELLTKYFQRRDQRSKIPMTDIMWFAIHSSRREAEISRLRWSDDDPVHLLSRDNLEIALESLPAFTTPTTIASEA